jgi:hypothetical protein
MKTLRDLELATHEFFGRHWNPSRFGAAPKWSEPWPLIGPRPNTNKQGTYAFLSRNEIIYVGVGGRRGQGIYIGCGLGARLNEYTRVKEGGRSIDESRRSYVMVPQWAEVDHVVTIGFEREYSYLAAALEVFLIRELRPNRNVKKPGQ